MQTIVLKNGKIFMEELSLIMRKLRYEIDSVDFKTYTYVDIQRIDVVCTAIVFVDGLLQDNSVYFPSKMKHHKVSEKQPKLRLAFSLTTQTGKFLNHI